MRRRKKFLMVLFVFPLVLLISSCSTWYYFFNHAPVVKNPHPANNATGVPINITLTWEAEDEDGDPLTYDVYFGKGSSLLLPVKVGISEKKYNPGTLEYGTTYYWRVVARDNKGGESKSPVWKFTTMSVPDHTPRIIWQKTLGGSGYDEAGSIQQTSDGGYIVAGGTYSNDGDVSESQGGGGDVWIVKLDRGGSIQWKKTLGGSDYDEANSIQQTSDGGYIVAGETYSNDGDVSGNHGGGDVWVVKLDSSGNILWGKALGGSDWDGAYSVQQTSDGGYIVAGWTASNDGDVSENQGERDAWIVKLDSSGNIQWEKALGGSDDDEANSIQQTSDGGYIVAGETYSNDGDVSGNHGGGDVWVVKLDENGEIKWQEALGGSEEDRANSIQQTSDGGYIVAGWTASNDGDVSEWHEGYDSHGYPCSDYWIVKLDKDGNIQWEKALGGSDWDGAYSAQQTSDGGYIVAGVASSNDGDVSGWHEGHNDYITYPDYWVVKLDSSGNIEWQEALGGSGWDGAYSVQQTSDGGYIIAGYTESNDGDVSGYHEGGDIWIVKLNW